MLNVAVALAADDPWESCLFAEIFSVQADFEAEAKVFEEARKATEGEKSRDSLRSALETLRNAALANFEKGNSNISSAVAHLKKISSDEK